jgi:hypothetical protein
MYIAGQSNARNYNIRCVTLSTWLGQSNARYYIRYVTLSTWPGQSNARYYNSRCVTLSTWLGQSNARYIGCVTLSTWPGQSNAWYNIRCVTLSTWPGQSNIYSPWVQRDDTAARAKQCLKLLTLSEGSQSPLVLTLTRRRVRSPYRWGVCPEGGHAPHPARADADLQLGLKALPWVIRTRRIC